MQNSISILILFWILTFVFIYREIRKTDKSSVDNNWTRWALLLLFVGVLLRTVYLNYPYWVHPDEALCGYESWCLANYGVDQHLNSWPIYFKSWGSGQTTLYAYLAIPFIKLFGLSAPTFRLVMALVGCISLFAFYLVLNKTQQNKMFVFIGVLFLALNPWHIIKSRWALDCNLSPDFILIGICLFIFGYYASSSHKKYVSYLSGSFLLALAAYSYGINWFMLPTLCILLAWYFYKEQKISIAQIASSMVLLLIVLTPILIYALLLVSKGESFKIGAFSFVQLDASRHEMTTVFGSPTPFATFMSYMKHGLMFILTGSDSYTSNSLPFFGQFYNILAFPFIAIAFIDILKAKRRTVIDTVFLLWLMSMLPILLLIEPNANHWNALWFPLIYFSIRGLCIVFSKQIIYRRIGIASISVLCMAFLITYFLNQQKDYKITQGVETSLRFTKALNIDTIYVPGFSYALSLFYVTPNPYEFRKTLVLPNKLFDNASQFSNLHFVMPQKIEPKPQTAYVLANSEKGKLNIDESKFQVFVEPFYTIYWNK